MIYIEMEMPEKCSECRFETEYGFCKAMPDNFCGNTDDNKKPEWCPLKESAGRGKWIYCEDEHGQDGYKCSECGFFVPWFYDFETINFINNYKLCPSCGKTMENSTVGEVGMTDKEKVIKGLKHCDFGVSSTCYEKECPYYQSHDCIDELKNDILVLLKEQEAVIEKYRKADGFLTAHGWKW